MKHKVIPMEKRKSLGNLAAFALALALMLSLAAASGAAQFAAPGAIVQHSQATNCFNAPEISVSEPSISLLPGRLSEVKITVRGTQPQVCGVQTYGVDFTNAYDAENFELAIFGKQERNTFPLAPGETREFVGLVGAKIGAQAGNRTIQVTGYLEMDHWKQSSKNIAVKVGAQADSDAVWRTPLKIGWNLVPYVDGSGLFGCPNITQGYRYFPSKQDYVVMGRFGALFSPMPNEKAIPGGELGGIFVFSTLRCTMESRHPPQSFGTSVPLQGGQLLSMTPAWHGKKASDIISECQSQSGGANASVEIGAWDAQSQEWRTLMGSEIIKNGEVLRIKSGTNCTLGMGS
jgi:hypothetical protein